MAAADRHLLFGLLALQNGIINQGQLVAAFQAWSLDKSRSLAEHLEARGDLTSAKRAVLDALAAVHVETHGGSVEQSLAAVPSSKSTRASLAGLGEPAIEATLERITRGKNGQATAPDDDEAEHTAAYSVGTATSDGQRFRILRPHARGGLGAVFVALDSELHREVALKQILEKHADDPVSRQRFVAEAEITGALEHPGIVPVYGLGTDAGGRPYYAMRFIKGDSLKEAIDRFHKDEALTKDPGRRSLELRKLLRRFTDVCNAIDYAHSRGVIHRDLKPANIIVGKHGETLVVDWGLAKAVGRADPSVGEQTIAPSSGGSSETLPGSALGTPAYMSPEQARGDLNGLGPRSDVYSLGATLYCLLTGKPPFESDDIGGILRAVQEAQFPRPSQRDPSLDKALEAVCLKAMATDPTDRYPTPKALADDLERWMADEPVTAWREPFSSRARRWARRNRTAVTSLAASVLVALAGTGAVLAVQTQANGRLVRANGALEVANGRVTEANAELKSANAREKERFNLAMDAIKLFHGEVSEDLLMKERQFDTLRNKLLKGAADFYGRLEGLLKDQTDRESRSALGTAYDELGALTEKIGDQTAALAVQRKALAVRRSLASERGANAGLKLDIARSLNATGWLQRSTGDTAGARAAFEEARRLAEEAQTERGVAEQAQEVLGRAYHRIAYVLSDTGDKSAALAAYSKALAIRQKLTNANPGVARFQLDLAMSHNNFGNVLYDTLDMAGTRAAYDQALAIRQKLADANPSVTQFQLDLAMSHNNIGIVLRLADDTAGARAAYGKALAILQKLADSNPSVTQFQRDLATSHSHVASVLPAGDLAGRLAMFGQALAIRQKLADSNPSVTQFQRELAMSHSHIGRLLSATGDRAGALAALANALAIQQKLADANPSVTDFQLDVSTSHLNIGWELHRQGDTAGARAEFGRMLAIDQRLADANPGVSRFERGLAASHYNIGRLLSESGDPSGALATYGKALAIRQKLADANPSVAPFRQDLAWSHHNIGWALFQSGDLSGAHAAYAQSLTIREKLAAANPTATEIQRDLVASHNLLSDLLRLNHHPAEARDGYNRALAIAEPLAKEDHENSWYQTGPAYSRRGRGLARLDLGDLAGAHADTRRALQIWDGLPTRTGENSFEAACCHATLAAVAGREGSGVPAGEARVEAEQAMALLKQAAGEGNRDLIAYRTETALDVLRSRADFQLLMLDLTFPTDPFARGR
jgi:tetratricopeptide (TPR) repeat protein/tRNA A-37 threonylcarbamoyl transferase component Bud32